MYATYKKPAKLLFLQLLSILLDTNILTYRNSSYYIFSWMYTLVVYDSDSTSKHLFYIFQFHVEAFPYWKNKNKKSIKHIKNVCENLDKKKLCMLRFGTLKSVSAMSIK